MATLFFELERYCKDRMRLVNEKLAADLLEMGKKEFLLCGFQGANLRSIAASMGVTTGAIYRLLHG